MNNSPMIKEIIITQKAQEGKPPPEVTYNENGDEVVAIISAESIVTLDGFMVKIVEYEKEELDLEEINDFDGMVVVEISEAEGIEFVEKQMNEKGMPLDSTILGLVIDSWHEYLEKMGIAMLEDKDKDKDN